MEYRDKLIKQLREPDQLELFDDPMRGWARQTIAALIENEDKIREMHDVMQKVLAGEPGYAAKPTRKVSPRKRKAA